ncbi:hypothetical protein ALC56_13300 [Trachymyrmex septentrionalis]|uniref:Uncharacterized protein n=1 Tax=Trachymyrmex septentrionalis TaxID=34720 RepID=A0A195EW29_9HYME|nr:hypothetical protein ALC56_13300 [Trachymyrmex septentrionalis]
MCDRGYRLKRHTDKRWPLHRRFGMPLMARAIIHYLTSSHVFPVHPPCPDVQRNVRVRQTGGGAKAKRMRHGTAGLGNQMSDICKKYFLRDLYRKIDGAVLTSQNERDLDCAITFQTHSILQRFMLRFDQLQLDCNDHLYIYDGAHAVGSYKIYIADYSRGAKRADIAICATSPIGYMAR